MLVFGLEPITASVYAAEADDRKCKYHYGSAFAASIGWVPRQNNNMGGENNLLASASAVTEHPTPARACVRRMCSTFMRRHLFVFETAESG